MAAFAAFRLSLAQPHPGDTSWIFFADTAHQAWLERGRNLSRIVLSAWAPFNWFNIKGVVVTGQFGQQFALLQTRRMLERVAHCHYKHNIKNIAICFFSFKAFETSVLRTNKKLGLSFRIWWMGNLMRKKHSEPKMLYLIPYK